MNESLRTPEKMVPRSGVELIEAELGGSIKDAKVSEVIAATKTLHGKFQELANANDGVLDMQDYDAVEVISCTRKVYESIEAAQATYQQLLGRLENVPVPDFVANDNAEQRIAA